MRSLLAALVFLLLSILPARADTILVGLLTRSYIVYTDPAPTAIVIAYHGTLGTSQAMADLTKLHLQGAHAIVIYPQGILWTWDVSAGSKDVKFTQALITKFRKQYGNLPVDVVGISAGGSMVWRDIEELDIAHAVSVAGDCLDPDTMSSVSKPDLLQLHGDADALVPLQGGTSISSGVTLPPIQSCIDGYNRIGGMATLNIVQGGGHAWDLRVGYPTTLVTLAFFGLR